LTVRPSTLRTTTQLRAPLGRDRSARPGTSGSHSSRSRGGGASRRSSAPTTAFVARALASCAAALVADVGLGFGMGFIAGFPAWA
jgi:hypothetical protein